jgi:hypothetical protein
MRYVWLVLLISACSIPNPRNKEVAESDMATSTDMGNDDLNQSTPDLNDVDMDDERARSLDMAPDLLAAPDLSTAPDMAPCLADTTSDVNNCGSCGNKCVGDSPACDESVCKYTHEDGACEAFFNHPGIYWTDTYPVVDGTNNQQAGKACDSCLGIAAAYGQLDQAYCVDGAGTGMNARYTMGFTIGGVVEALWFMYSDGSVWLANSNSSPVKSEGAW